MLVVLSMLAGYVEATNVALLYPILEASLDQATGLSGNPFLSAVRAAAEVFPTDLLVSYGILFVIVSIMVFLLRLTYNRFSVKTTADIQIETQRRIFSKYLESDYQFFVDLKQGELLYKANIAIRAITKVFNALAKMLADSIIALSVLSLLISISWKATLAVAAASLGYFLLSRYLGRRVSYTAGKAMVRTAEQQNVLLNEYIGGVKQIRASLASPRWKREFNTATSSRWRYWQRDAFWSQVPALAISLVIYTSIGIVVIGIRLLYPDSFASMIPMFGTFAYALLRLLPRIGSFSTFILHAMSNLPDLELIAGLLKDQEYNQLRNGERPFPGLTHAIEFHGVSFAHKGREATLRDVSLRFEKDRVTALVGPSGSGKSTLVDLLLRLYEVDSGSVCLDGVDLGEYDISTFLTRVGFVGQDTFLYNASVKDNIGFGDEYGLEQTVEAARLANAHEFIEQLPQGYDTVVGDRGVRLSVGERQRIAIARAMIRNPEILILDEATSSLDTVSESIVQEAVDRVSERCTTIVIAHRLSTIRKADTIYVLDEGRVVESGTHDALIEKRGKYWELYRTQDASTEKG